MLFGSQFIGTCVFGMQNKSWILLFSFYGQFRFSIRPLCRETRFQSNVIEIVVCLKPRMADDRPLVIRMRELIIGIFSDVAR